MWRLSGLHRHVTLTTKPATHIADMHLATHLTFGAAAAGHAAAAAANGAAAAAQPPLHPPPGPRVELTGAELTVTVHVVRACGARSRLAAWRLQVAARAGMVSLRGLCRRSAPPRWQMQHFSSCCAHVGRRRRTWRP